MVHLHPFFSYFGSKYRLAKYYPKPQYDEIIEPFAGSAGYSLFYPEKQITLYEIYEPIVELWQYLITVSPEEILNLPLGPFDKDRPIDAEDIPAPAKTLLGFWNTQSQTTSSRYPFSKSRGSAWTERRRQVIASQLRYIRHWKIEKLSFEQVPNRNATWYIDPPYEEGGKRYKYNRMDYPALAQWCKERRGEVIVCEQNNAKWLDFIPLETVRNASNKDYKEIFWYKSDMKKSNLGQFNTKNDVWLLPQVKEFIQHSGCVYALDPFAGAGDLLEAARGLEFKQVSGYDIDIEINKKHGWWYNDSLKEAPTEPMGTIVITNPPYLAKNSANRNEYNGYSYFDGNNYEDLYQLALEKVFAKYKYSVFIIPETYFLTDLFKEYLDNITILEDNPFEDTDCPVCVACFNVRQDFLSFSQNEYKIYKNNNLLFTNHELHNIVLDYDSRVNHAVFFNDANGVLGLRGVDGTNPEDRIRFCRVEDLGYDLEDIKESSRAITTIYIPEFKITDKFLTLANEFLEDLRRETHDLVLSPFKNNNKIGKRRRRLDYGLARKLINKTLEALTNGN